MSRKERRMDRKDPRARNWQMSVGEKKGSDEETKEAKIQ